MEPLSLSLGCLEGSSLNGDFSSPARSSPLATNSLNRRKINRLKSDAVRRSWGLFDKDVGNQEFWASIQEPYNFIMGTHLMPESYQIDGKGQQISNSGELELCWDPSDVSLSYEWSYSEFLDQYNELYEWLIQVQLKLYSHSNPPDKISRMAQQDEMNRQAFRRKLFVEQGESVARRYPSSAEEISWRVNYLNNKWEQLLTTLTPLKGHIQELEVEIDLAHEEEILCSWLSAVESQIQPLTCRLPKGSSVQTLQERYKDNQILLKDIEAHGPILKSVIRQYERLARNDANPRDESANAIDTPAQHIPIQNTPVSQTLPASGTATDIPEPSPLSVENPQSHSDVPIEPTHSAGVEPSNSANCSTPPKGTASKKVPRRARSLEKRWHQIYLRSLEWHYYLEGVISDFKNIPQSCSSESDDEPVSKCRRLSLSSASSSGFLSPCFSQEQRRRRRRSSNSLSEYDLTASDTGSFIEDEYLNVCCEESTRDQRKRVKRDTNEDASDGEGVILPVYIDTSIQVDTESCSDQVMKEVSPSENREMESISIMTEKGTNVKWLEGQCDRTSLTEVERPSANCGVFEYKHRDTDSEDCQTNGIGKEGDVKVQKETEVLKRTEIKRKYIRSTKTTIVTSTLRSKLDLSKYEEEVDDDALQEIIDSATLDEDWLDSNLTSDSESVLSIPVLDQEEIACEQNTIMVTNANISGAKDLDNLVPLIKKEPLSRSYSKESIDRLISDVDHLVSQGQRGGEAMTITPRQSLKPLPFGIKTVSKQKRIKQWLSSQNDSMSVQQDSCDASGELTTGESDLESLSSNPNLDNSTIRRSSGDLLESSENTPTVEVFPVLHGDSMSKVIRRGRKRSQNDQRPWSMTELHNVSSGSCGRSSLTKELDYLISLEKRREPGLEDSQQQQQQLEESFQNTSALSSSETALNQMSCCSFETNASSGHSTDAVRPKDATSPTTGGASPSESAAATEASATPPAAVYSSLTENPISFTTRRSPVNSTDSLKKRRPKLRRRSLKYLGRRTDSGSEEKSTNGGPRVSDSKSIYSAYNLSSIVNPLSSESESVSGCPRLSKSSSASAGGIACLSGVIVTSSTEQYFTDCSLTSGVPKPTVSATEIGNKKLRAQFPGTVDPLSPRALTSDNEATNTQEDVSSLSEQAWDPYQEFKYLSEPYSEDCDHDAAHRLLDFGDDYRKYIDSDCSSLQLSCRRRRSPYHRKFRTLRPRPSSVDSDSDVDDLHHVINESKSQLNIMENLLEKYSCATAIGLDFTELLNTAKTNIKCLQEILKHLRTDAPDLQAERKEVEGILQRWEVLESKALERQRQLAQLRQLQRQVKNQRQNLERIADRCAALSHAYSSADPSQLKQKVEESKVLLDDTEHLKSDISSLNVIVHRFTVDNGPSLSPLKDDIAELYRLFDETQRRVRDEVSRLESAEGTWRLWEEQREQLMDALKQDSETLQILGAAIDSGSMTESTTASVQDVAKLLSARRKTPIKGKQGEQVIPTPPSNIQLPPPDNKIRVQSALVSLEDNKDGHLSDSGTSGYESCSSDDLSERERRLAYLKRLARELEANLVLIPGSKAWNEICSTLSGAEKELRGLQSQCRNLILRTAGTLDQGPAKSSLPHGSPKRRCWGRDGKGVSKLEKRKSGRGNRGWVGRVVRAALPFQVAFLLLLCVACLLEPSCCDSVNTFNLSLSPQLRYAHGTPPH